MCGGSSAKGQGVVFKTVRYVGFFQQVGDCLFGRQPAVHRAAELAVQVVGVVEDLQIALAAQFLQGTVQRLRRNIEFELIRQRLSLDTQRQHQPHAAQTQAERFHAACAQTAGG